MSNKYRLFGDSHNKIKNLMVDLSKGGQSTARSLYAEQGVDIENELRNKFYNVLGVTGHDDRRLRSRMDTRKNEIAELLIDTIVEMRPREMDTAIINRFVETRNLGWDDSTRFRIQDNSLYTISKYSGVHWDTIRQRFHGAQYINVPLDAYYVAGYIELFEFLRGQYNFQTIVNRINESINYWRENMFYQNIIGLSKVSLPAEFSKSGDGDYITVTDLIEHVGAMNGNSSPILMGSRNAFRRLEIGIPPHLVSNEMANTINAYATLPRYSSFECIPLNPTIGRGTMDFDEADKKIFILPGGMDYRPFKYIEYGYPLLLDNPRPQDNQDQTFDRQIQFYAGSALVVNGIFGVYELTV